MSARKRVRQTIAMLDKQLRDEQMQLFQHRAYFRNWFEYRWLSVAAFLLPAFFAGWQSGKVPVHRIKQFGKLMMLQAASHIKKL